MEEEQDKIFTAFKAINILQLVCAFGFAGFACITATIIRPDRGAFSWSNPFAIILTIFTAIAFPLSVYVFRSGVKKAVASDDFDQKIALYRAAFINRSSILQGCIIFSIITALVNNCYAFYIYTAISYSALLYMWLTLPKMKADLNVY